MPSATAWSLAGPLGCPRDGGCCCRLSTSGGVCRAPRDYVTSPVSCLRSQDGWQESCGTPGGCPGSVLGWGRAYQRGFLIKTKATPTCLLLISGCSRGQAPRPPSRLAWPLSPRRGPGSRPPEPCPTFKHSHPLFLALSSPITCSPNPPGLFAPLHPQLGEASPSSPGDVRPPCLPAKSQAWSQPLRCVSTAPALRKDELFSRRGWFSLPLR